MQHMHSRPFGFSGCVLPSCQVPWMEEEEVTFLSSHVANQSISMLEYGSGGSTYMFASEAVMYFSVENKHSWCRVVTSDSHIHQIMEQGRLIHRCVKPWGPAAPVTRELSYPMPGEEMAWFIPYVQAPWMARADGENIPRRFDVVLIDGRFRLACLCFVVLSMIADEKSTIFLHDYGRYRGFVEAFLEPVVYLERQVGSLAKLKLKQEAGQRPMDVAMALYREAWSVLQPPYGPMSSTQERLRQYLQM